MRRFFIALLLVAAIAVEVWRNLPPELRRVASEWVELPRLPGLPPLSGRTGSEARDAVLGVARGEIGIRERSGRNDGEVTKYIEAVGLDPSAGHPYCAAFVYWCSREAGVRGFPRSAWSPDFVARPTWKGGQGKDPQPGDAFGIWFASRGRVAHAGLVDGLRGPLLVTVEANTSGAAKSGSAADREGQGVFRKYRHLRTVHAVQDWIGE